MDSKYSNIFWHQGVKIFEKDLLKTEKGRIRVSHLENDVTKSLLNVFQHGSKKLLGTFLKLIDVKQAPETFEFDFQVTDTYKYRQKNDRIMLSIISAGTQTKSDLKYRAERSQPDACIFNKDTAILIEAKTQSPLISEQVESHIKHFLGTATKHRILTWEEICERFQGYKSSGNTLDSFLLSQFTEFLNLIGLARFRGFLASDFSMLGAISKISGEEYLDFKRLFHRKIEKFMQLLNEQIKDAFQFKKYNYQVGKVNPKSPDVWSAFYFFDDEKTHVNEYPNINFSYYEHGIELALNAEVQPSVKKIISFIKKNPKEFDGMTEDLSSFNFSLYYKYQYLPQDNFIWNLIPGYPKEMSSFTAEDTLSTIKNFEQYWPDYTKTLFFQMKNGMLKHPSGRFFSEKELECAQRYNKKPNYIIRVEKRYSSDEVKKLKKSVTIFFKDEVLKLKKLVESVVNSRAIG